MAQILYDRIKETGTVTGTGDVTLSGAVAGFRTFSSVFASGTVGVYDPIYYCVIDASNNWEVGKGHLSGATTFVRDTVFSSSNSNSAVSFGASTAITIFNTITADRMEEIWTKGEANALAMGLAMP